MKQFKYFLGIDQTGAIKTSGEPKPLKSCLINKETNQIKTIEIPQLVIDELPYLLDILEQEMTSLAIIVDCVLGLPKAASIKNLSIWDYFRLASFQRGFGLKYGELFFSSFWNDESEVPKRRCEELANANSIFKSRPFQKNIQTGSFRIWKELGAQKEGLNIWPYPEFDPSFSWMFEGYPSLSWQLLIKSRSRKPSLLKQYIKKSTPLKIDATCERSLMNDSDLADAFILAETGRTLLTQGLEPKVIPGPEGWILGLEFS